MNKKEIKIEINEYIYNTARELDINIEELLIDSLLDKICEINRRKADDKFFKQMKEYENYWNILKIVRKLSKTSKSKYASYNDIVAEGELEHITEEETNEALKKLIEKNIITEPVKSKFMVKVN